MPWIHFHLDSTGYFRACCTTSITYGQLGEDPDLKNIEASWNSASARKFRTQLLSGIKDKRCQACYSKEQAGKSSMRTETLSKFESLIPKVLNETDQHGYTNFKPVYLDIRYSNLCNFKCRTCWHGASSSWFEEAQSLGNQVGSKPIIKATLNNALLIKNVLRFSDELSEVYFAGGEPLTMPEHYQFLQSMIEEKQTKAHLRYNTNLSTLHYRKNSFEKLWKQFRKITLSVSIDGLKEKGEYIRKGLKWNRFITNFRRVREEMSWINLQIAPTVSVFNIMEIGKIHRYFVEEALIGINDIYLNLLERPFYYNIKVLPEADKEKANVCLQEHIQWLTKHMASKTTIDEFASLGNFLFEPIPKSNYHDFLNKTRQLDQMRNESYEKTFGN